MDVKSILEEQPGHYGMGPSLGQNNFCIIFVSTFLGKLCEPTYLLLNPSSASVIVGELKKKRYFPSCAFGTDLDTSSRRVNCSVNPSVRQLES